MEHLKTAYTNFWWARLAACIGLLLCGFLLYWISGGFPPWAWRFFATILPQMARLWAAQGPAVLLPLSGLGLLSLSLLILWGVLLGTAVKVAFQWWQNFYAHQHFALELEEAHHMADLMAGQEREESERMQQLIAAWQPRTAQAARASQRDMEEPPSFAPPVTYAPMSGNAISARNVNLYPERAAASGNGEQANISRKVASGGSSFARNRAGTASRRYDNATPFAPSTNALPPNSVGSSQHGERHAFSASLPPSPAPVRNQLHLVPRPVEEKNEEYDTIPFLLVSEQDILRHANLPTTEGLSDGEKRLPEATLRFIVGAGLDPGIVRKDAPNEDTLLAIQGMHTGKVGAEPIGLFVVADGMGGHAHGQEASRMAVQSISDVVAPALLRNADDDETFADLLKDGAHRANLAIYRRNREQEHMMGTTLTSALVVGTTAYVVNVGDSRTYLYRPNKGLTKITRDHSRVAQLVEDGLITPEEIYTHPKRNQIYRCLGNKASLELDAFVVPLQVGDILLLCSDGLWEMVRDPDIARIMSSSAPHASQISSMLIQSALTRGGVDNVSVVVVCVTREEV